MRSYAILLVEDNPDDVKLTLRAFARNNIANEMVVARDGAEALDYLFGEGRYAGRDSSKQPALVLLDLKLPRVTGLQVLGRIRADERTRDVPVVILTSSSEAQDVTAGYAAGANNYLRKPVHFASFLNAARSVGLFWTLVESALALLHPEIDVGADGGAVGGPNPAEPSTEAPPLFVATPVPRPNQPRAMEVVLGMADVQAAGRLAAALESDGYTVRQVHSATAVFSALFTCVPDVLVLVDDLPGISGTDMIRAFRESPQGRAVTSVVLAADVARCRSKLPDEDVHILNDTRDPQPVVALMRKISLSALLRDLAAERERMQPPAAPGDTSRGLSASARSPSPADPWGLLDLPAAAHSAAVAHAVQTLTNALEERAAQATSAYIRNQSSTLAARLRRAANELIEQYPPAP